MTLSIIIVSYNTKNLLKACLESIGDGGLEAKKLEIFVVDNASTDSSIQMVKKSFPKVELITNSKNLGFSAANNQALKKTTGDYVLLLNSDTEIKPGALKKLVSFMETHPKAGIASAKLLNPDGTIQQSGGFLPRLSNLAAWMFFIDDLPIASSFIHSYHKADTAFYKKSRKIGWVQGAAMILRKKALLDIGLLDEKIFMYGEDIELCFRAQKTHWQVWHVAEAEVVHKKFQSSGGSSQTAVLGEVRGLKYIFSKHKPKWQLLPLRVLLKTGFLLRLIIFGTIIRSKSTYASYQKAFNLA